MTKKLILTGALYLIMLLLFSARFIEVKAQTSDISVYTGNKNVTFSPDKKAFTFGYLDKSLDKHSFEYEGYRHNIFGNIGLAKPSDGQHVYEGIIKGNVPIAYWELICPNSSCCHSFISTKYKNHGYDKMGSNLGNCYRFYPPGWKPVCAICGEEIVFCNFYMSEKVADTIRWIPSANEYSTYFYLCPYDKSLENEVTIKHKCKGISENRYRVVFDSSGGEGKMGVDHFMYGNAESYEGDKITVKKTLSKCIFSKKGCVFSGWSIAKGGEAVFKDGEDWLNVQKKVNAGKMANDSTITLYAVWKPVVSQLDLSFDGGYIGNDRNLLTVKKEYGTRYELPVPKFDPFVITFEAVGGENVPRSVSSARSFTFWNRPGGLNGSTDRKVYVFSSAVSGSKDKLIAGTTAERIKLPVPKRNGYSFKGWFNGNGRFVGGADDYYMPEKSETLYAHWEEASLSLVASCDMSPNVNGGKGAVDLEWTSAGEERTSIFRVYESTDGANWENKGANGGNLSGGELNLTFGYDDGREIITEIKDTGIYNLEIYGACGGDFGEHKGGLSGKMIFRVYLLAGERIGIICGEKGGDSTGDGESFGGSGGGGKGYGNAGGGGATEVYLYDRYGNRSLIASAGGGGGAGRIFGGGDAGNREGTLQNGESPDGTRVNTFEVNGESRTEYGIGGGGGYYPGRPGKIVTLRHVHSEDNPGCNYHTHTGSELTGGGCYSKKISENKSQTFDVLCYYEGTSTYTCQNPGCGKTGTLTGYKEYGVYYGASWHYTGFSGYPHCPKCGDNHGVPLSGGKTSGKHTIYYTDTRYELDCGLEEGFNCTNEDNDRIDDGGSISSGGGGNWANEDIVFVSESTSASEEENGGVNGRASIKAVLTGCYFQNYMNDIPAPDLAPPATVNTVDEVKTGKKNIVLSWNEPEDLGTKYYFKVDNYSLERGEVTVSSNIEEKTVITGVAGYYVKENTGYEGSFSLEGASYVTKRTYEFSAESKSDKWIYIAPVDRAGNIGNAYKYHYKPGQIQLEWDVYTKTIEIESGDNVYASGNTYYVRADGRTPFYLDHSSYIEGNAGENYQINRCYFSDADNGSRYVCVVPENTPNAKDGAVSASNISYSDSGTLLIYRNSDTEAVRKSGCTHLSLRQGFLANNKDDQKRITIIPRAEVKDERGLINTASSVLSSDKKNGINLILDGKAPEIRGLEGFDPGKLFIDGSDKPKSIVVSAIDSGSGLNAGESYVKIYNLDNAYELNVSFSESKNGQITLNFDKKTIEELFYSGSFKVIAYAVDMVGNETEKIIDGVGFDLNANVVRLLESIDGKKVFARGESGELHIVTTGYVDYVEVFYPEELSSYNTTYDYSKNPEFMKEETQRFMIPLYDMPEGNLDFTIKVVAHKKGESLDAHPRVSVVKVSGSILDELKTGLE